MGICESGNCGADIDLVLRCYQHHDDDALLALMNQGQIGAGITPGAGPGSLGVSPQ
jgi:hypothetical protein